MAKRKSTPRPRNGNTWTEARFWQAVRSALRGAFKWWKPMGEAKKAAKVGYNQYKCAQCGGIFAGKEVQVDHMVPCGSLKSYDDIGPWLERLCIEDVGGFQVLCKAKCHKYKSYEERYGKPHPELMKENT